MHTETTLTAIKRKTNMFIFSQLIIDSGSAKVSQMVLVFDKPIFFNRRTDVRLLGRLQRRLMSAYEVI